MKIPFAIDCDALTEITPISVSASQNLLSTVSSHAEEGIAKMQVMARHPRILPATGENDSFGYKRQYKLSERFSPSRLKCILYLDEMIY